ncbi:MULTISPECIES: hypothetical protein [unclassified Endozoicomonas]|uniref:hypothetical protein n=1 Tax=unclassified Endozoicomonas TaxID=2644528 RepID=UPI003BB078C9
MKDGRPTVIEAGQRYLSSRLTCLSHCQCLGARGIWKTWNKAHFRCKSEHQALVEINLEAHGRR